MPVYLFTFHAYRSWMPDHNRGYTRRNDGYLPPDESMAENYRRRANGDETIFDEVIAKALIEQLMDSCRIIGCRLDAGTSEPTHLHGLVSWSHDRTWLSVRTSLKTSLTKRLKQIDPELGLSRGASRRHVEKDDHFSYLLESYLPGHHGLAWYEHPGWIDQSGTRYGM